ncbi:hypothetical protein ACFPIJ_57980 [Dactylosporangium cerinum]|uniref:Integral membrane protein n=1 Tax=Dactylosporangium cerinum TaxID=1434730 RepID=A0ABV9WKE0_9ACTN
MGEARMSAVRGAPNEDVQRLRAPVLAPVLGVLPGPDEEPVSTADLGTALQLTPYEVRLGSSAARTRACIARLAVTANWEPSSGAQRRLTVVAGVAGVAAVLTVLLFAALITLWRADDDIWPSGLSTYLRAAVHGSPLAGVLDRGAWQRGWPVTVAANTWRSVWPAVWPALRPSVWPSVWPAVVHDLAAGR